MDTVGRVCNLGVGGGGHLQARRHALKLKLPLRGIHLGRRGGGVSGLEFRM